MELTCISLISGRSIAEDINNVRSGAQVIVATPGRLFDMISRGILKTGDVRMVILDEFDSLISIGFTDLINDIFHELPRSIQVGLFSPVLSPPILELSKKYLNEPTQIIVPGDEFNFIGLKQYQIIVEKDESKFCSLADLCGEINFTSAILFVNTSRKAQWLENELNKNNFSAACIHSSLSQNERQAILDLEV